MEINYILWRVELWKDKTLIKAMWPCKGHYIHTESEILIRYFRMYKNVYDLTLCQSCLQYRCSLYAEYAVWVGHQLPGGQPLLQNNNNLLFYININTYT